MLVRNLIKYTLEYKLEMKDNNLTFSADGLEALTEVRRNMTTHLETLKNTDAEIEPLYTMLILDNHMPSLNGFDVLKKCKELYAEKKMPMPKSVLITAVEDPHLRECALKEFDYFYGKSQPIAQLE